MENLLQIEDPCDLMYKMLEDIEKTKVQKTKFLLRMLPIPITCKVILKNHIVLLFIFNCIIFIIFIYICRPTCHP